MNVHAPVPLTKAAFLRWAEGREGRYELKDGMVAMMVGGSILHAWIASDIQAAIRSRMDRAAWRVATADIAIEISDDIRYPDVVVLPASSDVRKRSASNPCLIVEVMSPSSIALDMHVKAAEYMSLDSLECYIVAAQDEPRVWVWNRAGDAGRHWPRAPLEVVGRDAGLDLPALGITLPMAEIYAALKE